MYLIQGKTYSSFTPEEAIDILTSGLDSALSQPPRPETVLACAGRFIEQLKDHAFLPQLGPAYREEVRRFCQPDALRQKLEHELGENPFSVRRINYREPLFEGWRPLGVVVHITPANAELLPFFAIIESLLVGNINWLRPSASEQGMTIDLLEAFTHFDLTGQLANFVAVIPVETTRLSLLLTHADGVSAWGGDTALDAIRQQLPGGCRWIPWGHKISFAWLQPDAVNEENLLALADDVCCFDQQACSSPQIVFVDSDESAVLQDIGNRLAQAMRRRHARWQPLIPDEKAAADITSAVAFAQLDAVFAGADNALLAGDGWRIILQNMSAITPSPLFRTILLRPLPQNKVMQTLRPWRTHLQTCGLIAADRDRIPFSQLLLAAGVNRITPVGKMHDGYHGEPHDGVYALSQLARRVTVTLDADVLPQQATLDANPPPPVLTALPIMDKTDFLQHAMHSSAQLFFRSGGSSGVPKLAGFTYRDYRRQMQAAAAGMFAAGLDPARDKVLNLMYAGNLYGGLLSFFTVLEMLEVTHLPMGGPHDDDYHEIARTIVNQGVTTLIGMPSTLYQLFTREEAILRDYGGIQKLLLGGEHMGAAQRDYIHGFGVKTIRSALYGSVDAGPLGHACAHCPDGIFHLMTDIQWLEIVDPLDDRPVAPGEAGRLLFTSTAREGQKVIRYDIGDMGRWLPGECPCGAPSPRFELLGRHGSLVRIGTMFIQPQRLATLADAPVQLILQHNPRSGLECIHIFTDGNIDTVKQRVCTDPELKMALDAHLLELAVTSRPFSEFERHPQSGKTPLVIDKRR
ncbi:acyl-CoA reductase [Klebsiella michiganensis]|uniref:long-chain-fatty-acyl-CoA reductase n=1 Tax=Klebsiella michiganensis TaxID=1134687 RepID=A0A2J4RJP6_9ENTR|nr:acyl-CoA reductase [Klebsiella michiganensis]ELF4773291.1 long-chain-fatty-acyl-CoA reductase [Klebsiella michiganensis]MCY3509099.1 long-chain-fatty-acyl-CoA reductase [Klebsiella michiganensis]MDS7762137.1 acyl-CoA reductase [Klebsiella michiganensis]PLL43482.1 long-chain-fatty-acyl-CoA reductase [Klebsiella michiganensis]QMR56408.1 long-chain-fatty-acyl-CoA reductase [Klebsiella michiganensis]